jgi:hypothetical protein
VTERWKVLKWKTCDSNFRIPLNDAHYVYSTFRDRQCTIFFLPPTLSGRITAILFQHCHIISVTFVSYFQFTSNKPGMPEEEAWAWRRCWCVRFRTRGCIRTSILAHTVLSPCTKNANENEKWVLKTYRKTSELDFNITNYIQFHIFQY